MRELLRKIGAGRLFLIIVVAGYVVLGIVDFEIVGEALGVFWRIFKSILPVLGIVYLLLFVSNLFITTEVVMKYLGARRRGGWIISIVGGIISSGPIYLWYPLLSDLQEKGMRTSLIACFLYNRAVKIPLIPMMVLYFGPKLVTVLMVVMIVFSVINGIVVDRLD